MPKEMKSMDEMTIDMGRNNTTPSKSITSTSCTHACTVSIDHEVKRRKFYYFRDENNDLRIGKVIDIIDDSWINVRWYLKLSQLPRIESVETGETYLEPKELVELAHPQTPELINKNSVCAKVSVINVQSKPSSLLKDVLKLDRELKSPGSSDMYVCRYKLIKTTVYQLMPISYYDTNEPDAYSDDDRNSLASNLDTNYFRNEIDKLHLSTTERAANEHTKGLEEKAKQVTPIKIKIAEKTVQKVKRRNDNDSQRSDQNDNDDNDDDTVESSSPSKRSKLVNDSNQNYLPESPVGPKNSHPTVKTHKMSNIKKNLNISFSQSVDGDNDVFEDSRDSTTFDNDTAQYTSSLTGSVRMKFRRSKRPLQENNDDNCAAPIDTPSTARRNEQISTIEKSGPVTRRKSILKTIEMTPRKDTPKKSVSLNVDVDATKQNESTPRRQPQRRCSKAATALNAALIEEINESPDSDSSKTPRSRRAKNVSNSISDATTPRSTRRSTAFKTPSSSTMTPQQQRKLYRSGNLTPSIQGREMPMKNDQTELEMVRERLHVSAVPQSLPCREKEFDNIHAFVIGKLVDKCGGCIYVSGVPGTGKTATVTQVIRQIKCESKPRKLPAFDYIEINGMRLTEPRQAYVQIYRQLTGKTMAWAQARDLLEDRFTGNKKSTRTTILLVDELDIICNRKQDVVYNLFDWTTRKGSCLVAITIANTMDLPERVLKLKVASRLGLTRITFQPYSFKQLQEVVMARLAGSSCFVSDAVQLVARKVASISGDCRRALDICRRATEIAEEVTSNEKNHVVNFIHVNQALSEMFASPKVRAIKNCTKSEKLFLQAVASEITRTGIEEVDFYGVYLQIATLAPLLGISNPLTEENAMRVCMTLAQNRLLITEDSSMGLYQKIILNVSVDDLYYALNN